MSNAPLMPKATAVWLVDNTSLTFEQIAEFCGLHTLEVKGIADGDVAGGIKGMDPMASGQLTRDEIDRGQDNPKYKLKIAIHKVEGLPASKKKKRGPRYTPVSRRQDRPNAILWLLKNHPELTENEIIRLLGTTKNTIQAIAGGKHWNASQLQPVDPVTLALCTQTDLDAMVSKAGLRAKKERDASGIPEEEDATLISASETTAHLSPENIEAAAEALPEGWTEKPAVKEEEEEAPTAESVFGSTDKAASEAEEEEEALEAKAKQALASLNEKPTTPDGKETSPEDKNAGYKENVKAVCASYTPDIVDKIVKYLGIALRTSKDAATVACSDKSELERIRNGFMRKKLELDGDDAELDSALKEICEQMGSSNRSKCRVAFYYLLVEKYNKQELFA